MKEHLESCKSVLHAKATEPYTLNQRIEYLGRGLLAFLVVSAHALDSPGHWTQQECMLCTRGYSDF